LRCVPKISEPSDRPIEARVGARPLLAAQIVPHVSGRPGLVGAPACGDVMKLQIKVKEGKIEEAVFKAKPKPDGPLSPLSTTGLTAKTCAYS